MFGESLDKIMVQGTIDIKLLSTTCNSHNEAKEG
jgi:hypothetical protein